MHVNDESDSFCVLFWRMYFNYFCNSNGVDEDNSEMINSSLQTE